MKKAFILFFLFLAATVFACTGRADVSTTFYGYTWARYAVTATGTTDSENEFLIPRCYIRLKTKVDEVAEAAVTFDLNNSEYAQSYIKTSDFNDTGNYTGSGPHKAADFIIYLKYAYLDLKNIIPEAVIRFGIQKVYFGAIDKWEYPLPVKEIMDDNKLLSSADLGLGIDGNIPGGWGEYQIGVYNGNGYKKMEDDPKKAVAASVMFVPLPGIWTRLSYYGDFKNDLQAKIDSQRVGVVAGFAFYPLEGHVQYSVPSDPSTTPVKTGKALEVFAVSKIPSTPLEVAFKYDNYVEDSTAAAAGSKDYAKVAGGMNWHVCENVKMQFAVENKTFVKAGTDAVMQGIVQAVFGW